MNKTIKKELILLEDFGMKYPTEKSKEKKRYGLYKCHCGKEFETIISDVKSGKASSCGCNRINHTNKRNTKHSLKSHRLYDVWNSIIQRCNNKNNANYKHYGLRGIAVCNEWLDINNFINDMYPTYEEGLTIDRIDSNGNYEKANCRWASREIQQRNKRIIQVNNTSGYKGVCLYKPSGKFTSSIRVNRKLINLGCYSTALEAAKVRDKYIIDNDLEHTLNFK